MGKRSNFERRERDFYPTPVEAVRPLLPHLGKNVLFCEPCAGDGALIDHLEAQGHECWSAWDIEPQRSGIVPLDATAAACSGDIDYFITNPPWSRPVLHRLITNLATQAPTWLLFDADWMHTKQAIPFLPFLRKVVSVGRVKWIKDSPHTGKDNCCWYLFSIQEGGDAVFIGRAA